MVRSVSRIRYLRTDSARDTALFAFSTALSSDARTSASLLASASVISGLPCAASQPGHAVGVERDERTDERALVADDDHLADQRVRTDAVLEHRRGDVLAAGRDDDLLLAPGDPQVAVVVERAEVTGAEPAVVHGLRGRRVVVVVAAEHLDALELDLAVGGDPDAAARQREPDRADLGAPAGPVDRRRRGGLGQAVALEHVQAEAAVEVAETLAEGRATRDGPARLTAERVAQLVQHEDVRHLVLEAEPRARARAGCRARASRRSTSWRPAGRSRPCRAAAAFCSAEL